MCMCVECAELDYKIHRFRQMAKAVDALTGKLVDELINDLQEQKTSRHLPARQVTTFNVRIQT
jgi:hypothetical protein